MLDFLFKKKRLELEGKIYSQELELKDLSEEVCLLQKELQDRNNLISKIQMLLKEDHAVLLGIESIHEVPIMIICKEYFSYPNSIEGVIFLNAYGINYPFKELVKLIANIKPANYEFDCSVFNMELENIQCFNGGKGYGSTLLQYLINYAKKRKVATIKGWLSPVDIKEDPSKLKHFYEKNGFNVTLSKNKFHETQGSINMELITS